MNISHILMQLEDLYQQSLVDNSPYFEQVDGIYRVSVTKNQASVLNLNTGQILITLVDFGTSKIMEQPSVTHSGKHSTLQIFHAPVTELRLIGDLVKYKSANELLTNTLTIPLNDITEEYLFQLSTVRSIPSIEKFEMITKYVENIRKICHMFHRVVMIDINADWDNIELTEAGFK